jgi:hypothetical protein
MLRDALCDNRVDLAFVTDHRTHMALIDFNDVIPVRTGDQVNRINGNISEIISPCDNGHKVRYFPGSENELMNLAQTRHPDPLPGLSLVKTYNTESVEAVKAFKATGALSGISHTEKVVHKVDELIKMKIDFLELYNLHANLGANVDNGERKNYVWIGKTLFNLLVFLAKKGIERDLFMLAFLKKNDVALKKWASIVTKMEMSGVAGSDVHRAITKLKLSDKEHLDGYRRITRWFSNLILLPDNATREEILSAIKKGKVISVFELFGTPVDFEFSAKSLLGNHEMGDVVLPAWPLNVEPVEFKVSIPKAINSPDAGPKATYEAVLYKATEKDGWIEVARSTGTHLSFYSFEKGVYRAEIHVKPTNLRGFLKGRKKFSERKYVWVYSNPIYIR